MHKESTKYLRFFFRLITLQRRRIVYISILIILTFSGIYLTMLKHTGSEPSIGERSVQFVWSDEKIRSKTSREKAIIESFSTTLMNKNGTRSACKLPKLDPFHESVMPFMKDLGHLECGDPYSKFENNVLTVQGDNIVAVQYKIIKRPDRSDFSVSLSEAVNVPNIVNATNEDNSTADIKQGNHGCVMHLASRTCLHPYGGLTHPSPGTKVVFHQDCCKSRILFSMQANGTIKHLPSGLCLHGDVKNHGRNIVLHPICSTVFMMVNGSLAIAGSRGMCLQPEREVLAPDNDELLISGRDCSATYAFSTFQGSSFLGRVKIEHDFVLVNVIHGGSSETSEVHMNASPRPGVLKRVVKPAGLPFNVVMIMFDSTSAANFLRKMPRTLEYLQELPTVFLKGHTIVGDGTTAQLCAMLTGIDERYQPEARRRMPGAKHVDDWRWIFRDYAERGYVTMFSEDSPGLGTFNYRLKGFRHPPTDHYGRYFWLEANKYEKNDYCTGNKATHKLTMDYLYSLFNAYPKNPKFAFLLFSALVHDNLNTLGYGDEDTYFLLKRMEKDFFLDETIVIIFGDHGHRFGPFRKTLQGKLEERLPHMSITFPKSFPLKYPHLYENIKRNSNYLTTPFDMYATLQHILTYPFPPAGIKTGQSLFQPIEPLNRTCKSAGVEDHWCTCLDFEKVSTKSELVKSIAKFAVEHINKLLDFDARVKRLCRKLTLGEIKVALREMPNEKLQKFKMSYQDHHCDSCGAMFGEKAKDTMYRDALYQIHFVTFPNNGFYEASVKLEEGMPLKVVGDISRVDRFGTQPDCIKDAYVHLIKYCYCK